MSDNISRADAICEVLVNDGIDNIVNRIKALPAADAVSREDYHNLLMASNDIDRALREYQEKEEAEAVHKPDYSYEADMVRRLKESRSAEAVPQMEHDREWIIGCIEHDGFIKTDRFDKANQIILDALSAEAKTKCVAQIKVDTEEVVRRIKEEYDITDGWILCSEGLPKKGEVVLITNGKGNVRCGQYRSEYDVRDGTHYWWWKGKTVESVLAWMPLPKPYREDGEQE